MTKSLYEELYHYPLYVTLSHIFYAQDSLTLAYFVPSVSIFYALRKGVLVTLDLKRVWQIGVLLWVDFQT